MKIYLYISYIAFAVLVSLYHGYRGFVLQKWTEDLHKKQYEDWPMTERNSFWSRHVYDAGVQFFCSVIGFLSWWLLFHEINKIDNISEISTGYSILIIFLFTFGFIGVIGYLQHIIQIGKSPFK